MHFHFAKDVAITSWPRSSCCSPWHGGAHGFGKGGPLRKGHSMLHAPPRAAGVVELKNRRVGQYCLLLRWTSD